MPNDIEDEICALLDAVHLAERDKREPLEEIEQSGDVPRFIATLR